MRIFIKFLLVLVFGMLLFAGNIRATRAEANVTNICGTLASSATWTVNNSPYDVCPGGASIPSGVTITINPGVTVQFEAGVGDKLNVAGALIADGNPTQPITLTGVSATPGSWGGISASSFVTPAVITLDYVTLEYAGVNGSFGAQVYTDRAAVTITHSLIRNGAGNGLFTNVNTKFDVHSTNFVGNGLSAIVLDNTTANLLMTDLKASGNGINAVRLAGTTYMPGQREWVDPGIPYIVDSIVSNQPGEILTIDPGNDLQFTTSGWLSIAGQLSALGTATAPITMTAVTKSPGAWRGLFVYGGASQAVAQLDYTTIEFAGNDINGANIYVGDGQLIAHHSIIRYSLKDGVRIDSNAVAVVQDSQIYGSGTNHYGVWNATTNRPVLATNNWWGDASGPKSDLAACSSGNGDKVTAGVLFQPILIAPGALNPIALSSAPMLSLTPQRWFAPADGLTRVYFDITLRDGNGTPLPGRTVKLKTTLGAVVDGGVTDASGHTLAYLTSGTTGDANVSASLDGLTSCEGVFSPISRVTFTQPLNVTDLLPNAPASYFDGDIKVSPMPVLTGVTTTISVKLTNPLTTTITVDVSFDYAQAGIGLVFGPIKDIVGQVIPGRSSVTLTADFVPVVAGHYCVQVMYNVTAVGPAGALDIQSPLAQRQLKQFNLNAQQSSTGGSGKGDGLQKTRNSLKNVNRFVDKAYSPNPFAVPLAVANRGIAWDLDNAEKISNALQGDPPRQDFRQIDPPVKLELPPIQAGGGVSPARAAALNALDDALAQANAYGTAAATALDRYGGATEANDLQWASLQSAALLEYNQMMGAAVITAAMKIDDVINVAASEGVTSVIISASDVISMQVHLASGFSPEEIADAHTVGLTDADIEAIRQSILNANPENLAGDLIPRMKDLRDQFYLLGNVLLHPQVFAPGFSVSGGAGLQPQANGNTLARVFDTVTTIQIGNPLTQTATIDLRLRRIDLPGDWMITVSPLQVTLSPGQQITATVSIIAGTPVAQGSIMRGAVEGYAGSQLLGGVVFDVLVPRYMPFDGTIPLYLPLLKK
jgi:hypothetical protein